MNSQQVIILSKFTNPGKFEKSADRIKELASSWKIGSDPIEITSAYFILCEEFDTMLIVKGNNLENIFKAVKHLESAGNVKCSVKVVFPIHLS